MQRPFGLSVAHKPVSNRLDSQQWIAFPMRWTVILILVAAGIAPPNCNAGQSQPIIAVLCQGHDRALAHWLEAARKGILPSHGVGVIHYDAHPDMGVPDVPLPHGLPADIEQFMAGVDIATFQLAAVRTGLIDRIVWLRPPWAEQFEDGHYAFHLGETDDGSLKVDQPGDYYATENAWAPLAKMRRTAPLVFTVARYDADLAALPPFDGPVILDIDLDIFSTRNPGAEALRHAGLTQAEIDAIAERFNPTNLRLSRDPRQRVRDIQALKTGIARLLEEPWYAGLAALPRLFLLGVGPLDLYKVYAAVEKMPPDLPIETIIANFEHAIGLPGHLSSEEEIDRVLGSMEEFLTSGGFRPALVTIARSVVGGFTPPEVAARVEKRLVRLLRNTLREISLRHDRKLASEP